MPQIVDCIAVSEPNPCALAYRVGSKLEGDTLMGPPWRWSGRGRRSERRADAADADAGIALELVAAVTSRPGECDGQGLVASPTAVLALGHAGATSKPGWATRIACGGVWPVSVARRGPASVARHASAYWAPGGTQQASRRLIASWMAFRFIRRPHVVVVTCRAARSSAGLVGHAWTSMGNDVTPCQVTVTSSPLPTSSTVSS